MAYNKASAERKWKHWKKEEEKVLRQHGMNEINIKELHDFDWKAFNSERRFLRRQMTNNDVIDCIGDNGITLPIRNINDILNDLGNQNLYEFMRKENHQTMQIIYLKICGFSSKEIARKLGVSEYTIRYRIRSIRKKLKKFD